MEYKIYLNIEPYIVLFPYPLIYAIISTRIAEFRFFLWPAYAKQSLFKQKMSGQSFSRRPSYIKH